MSDPSVFVGTPVNAPQLHVEWVAGALSMHAAFPGRHLIEVERGSFLPRQRDALTAKFLRSGCSHMLCVDSDIGWRAADVLRLLDGATRHDGLPFMAGVYCRKNKQRDLPFSFLGESDGPLTECNHAPGGFLLLARTCVEQLVAAYPELEYDCGSTGRVHALWNPIFADGKCFGEDVSFCMRWRAIGGRIWAHRGVVLKHFGDNAYEPETE